MATCQECKSFFPEEDPNKGDCVRRDADARQSFYKAKPVLAAQDASKCPDFQKK